MRMLWFQQNKQAPSTSACFNIACLVFNIYIYKNITCTAYLCFYCGQQDAVGGGCWRGLRPLFDHLGGNPDQARDLQTEQDLDKDIDQELKEK